MNCETCMAYPNAPEAIVCDKGFVLFLPGAHGCIGYHRRPRVESIGRPVDLVSSTSLEIVVGSHTWHLLYNGIQALFKVGYFTSKTLIHLLLVLEPEVEDPSVTVRKWLAERRLFREAAIGQFGVLGPPLHWRKVLDTLRQLYVTGKIDMDVVLVALDPERTGSSSVADLAGAWEQIRWHMEDSKDVFDYPAYCRTERDHDERLTLAAVLDD